MNKHLKERYASLSLAVIVLFGILSASHVCLGSPLRVMSYNILAGGTKHYPLSQTVKVIQVADADVIGIQEVGSSAQAIANALGFYYQGFNSDLAIISRYPITQVLGQGVKLQLAPAHEAYLFDVHLKAYPYQPYDIQAGDITTEAQAIAAAQAARSMTSVLNGMSTALASGLPTFLVGDFNEPSHLDWTQAAANAGMHFGMKVDWPTSRSVTNAGLVDAFRALRPDEVNDPANTWTPGDPAPNIAPNEVHDRIDFVYYAGTSVVPTEAKTLGYDTNDGSTDIGIDRYPSDHRAVVVQFDLPYCFGVGDLNGDCAVDTADWIQFRSNQLTDLTGLTAVQALAKGDLNADYRNNHADFVLFKQAYDAHNGAGAFVAMLAAVPEPATGWLAIVGLTGWLGAGRRRAHSTPIQGDFRQFVR